MKSSGFLVTITAATALAACAPEIIEAASTTDPSSEGEGTVDDDGDGDPDPEAGTEDEGSSGDGEPGDGDPDPGDGDPAPGDGDPVPGDGDPVPGDGDGDPAPTTEPIQVHDPNSCQTPLWCVSDINDPRNSGVASRISTQACFTSSLTPPLQLLEVNYYVGGKFGQLQDPRLRVFERTNNGPGNSLADVGLADSDFTVGQNNLVLGSPINLPSAGFCVGFTAGDENNGSAVGIAVDNGSMLVPDQSWVTAGQCAGINDWEDLVDLMPNPTGTWCIDVVVQSAP